MATSGKQNGTLLYITRDATQITHLTEVSSDFNMALIAATTKDSAGWEEHLAGLRGMTMTFSAAYDQGAAEGHVDLLAEITGRTSATYVLTTGVVGDSKITITGFTTNISQTAGTEDLRTFTGSFTATGAPTPSSTLKLNNTFI